eukprot:TRINITY_DN936_c0_g2_i1.p1 TRINITY_DN936_c0_g2~~TRINITY_DN936_c0_g2_i1.p1  ORF type:complete len:438 (+),score=48.93 TRINITY_DN936_c0_g2_i1:95-1408(+)
MSEPGARSASPVLSTAALCPAGHRLGERVRTRRSVAGLPVGTLGVVTACAGGRVTGEHVAEVRADGVTFLACAGDVCTAVDVDLKLGQRVRAVAELSTDQGLVEKYQVGVVTGLPGNASHVPTDAVCEARLGTVTLNAAPGALEAVCESTTVPRTLAVTIPPLPELSGEYTLLDVMHNDMPQWACGEKRLYASTHGNWAIGLTPQSPEKNTAWVVSREWIGSLSPHQMRLWEYYSAQGQWRPVDVEMSEVACEPMEVAFEQLKEECRTLHTELMEVQSAHRALQHQYGQLASAVSSGAAAVGASEERAAQSNDAQIAAQSAVMESMRQQIADIASQKDSEIRSLRSELASLSEQLNTAVSRISGLEAGGASAQARIDATESALATTSARIDAAESALATAAQESTAVAVQPDAAKPSAPPTDPWGSHVPMSFTRYIH